MQNNKSDSNNQFRSDLVQLLVNFYIIRENMVYIIFTNSWVLEDINMDERISYLIDMIQITNQDLDSFFDELFHVNDGCYLFDLLDEFDFFREIVSLEKCYLDNIIEYIAIVNNYSIQGNQITTMLEENESNSINYQKLIKINEKELRKIKLERSVDFHE